MPRVSALERSPLFGLDGRAVGEVEHVLFHPSEPRVVGMQVKPNPWYYVVPRKSFYAPLGNIHFTEEGQAQALSKRPAAGKCGDFGWDVTVVWRGMPVRDQQDNVLGAVHDVGFTKKSGRVTWLEISSGAVSDAAVGRVRFPGEAAIGFDGEAVVLDANAQAEGQGGIAKAAGVGAAVVTVHGERLAKAAGVQVSKAAYHAGRALKIGGKRIGHVRKAAERWLDGEGE